ncbi:DUF5992 family protein, partial [Aliikangiella maris]
GVIIKEVIMRIILLSFLIFISIHVKAGDFLTAAVPTGIDIVQAGNTGFMIYGQFGNKGCTTSNSVFVKLEHPQYAQIYSTALAAFMAGKKIQAYTHGCEAVGWYSNASITYNVLGPSGSLYLRN